MNKIKRLFKKKDKKKLTYKDIEIETIENEIHRENYKHSFGNLLKSSIYVLIIVLAVAVIVASLLMPVIEITDSSMKPLLNDNDVVLTFKTNKIKNGDVIAFYHGNKILVKRVIGVSGDWINISQEGYVYVNGNKLEESYVKEFIKGETDEEFPIQVGEKSVYVLSDERDILTDSRNEEIGQIKSDDVIGKVVIRIWPIKQIKIIK